MFKQWKHEGYSKKQIIETLIIEQKDHNYIEYMKTASFKISLDNFIKTNTKP